MKNIQIFENNEFGSIRTQIINDEPYFCLADVCHALDLEQPSRVKSRLKPDGVTTGMVIDSVGRRQNANFVNELNLYKVIFQSRKESAERFTDWVAGEVLPSIRKTGSYQKQLSPQEMMRIQLGMIDDHEDQVKVSYRITKYDRNKGEVIILYKKKEDVSSALFYFSQN